MTPTVGVLSPTAVVLSSAAAPFAVQTPVKETPHRSPAASMHVSGGYALHGACTFRLKHWTPTKLHRESLRHESSFEMLAHGTADPTGWHASCSSAYTHPKARAHATADRSESEHVTGRHSHPTKLSLQLYTQPVVATHAASPCTHKPAPAPEASHTTAAGGVVVGSRGGASVVASATAVPPPVMSLSKGSRQISFSTTHSVVSHIDEGYALHGITSPRPKHVAPTRLHRASRLHAMVSMMLVHSYGWPTAWQASIPVVYVQPP